MSVRNIILDWFIIFFGLSISIACDSHENTRTKSWNQGINIIPAPSKIECRQGTFQLQSGMKIYVRNVEVERMLVQFVEKINTSTGLRVSVTSNPEEGSIFVELVPDLFCDEENFVQEESYRIEVASDAIRIEARQVHGLFNAMTTLMQLLPAEIDSPEIVQAESWSVPCVKICDYPRFPYRGIMLDVARHFLPKDEVMEQIDVFSSLKINRLHLHLTDNQGWRVEIKSYPELTRKGSKRVEPDGSTYSGFYTQEDLREIVAYALERYVTIIPEIDIPAHSQALNVCIPSLSCTGKVTGVRSIWGPDHLVLCPGKEDMFEFMKDVYSELADIFPGEYYHVGGDECPKDNWEVCPLCQKRIRDEKLYAGQQYTAEEKLQAYTIGRVEKILAALGKKMIGWDEILQGKIARSATVMSWQDEKGGVVAASKGHHVIMTPNDKGLYFNYFQGDSKVEPVCFGNYAPLEKVYRYEPVPDVLKKRGLEHYVQGVQANLWSEYLYEENQWEYALYPRTMALAELAWTTMEKKDFTSFCQRLENSLRRLSLRGIKFHIPLPEMVGGSRSTVAFSDSVTVAFKTTRPVRMVYTLDGTEPDSCSSQYEGPFVFHSDAVLKIASIMENGAMSRVLTYRIQKQNPSPAVQIAPFCLNAGLLVETQKDKMIKKRVISSLSEITESGSRDKSIDSVESFISIAEGYVKLPSEGVYTFSTNYDEFWIDDRLLIDNRGEVKRFSRKDNSKVLSAGFHKIKVVFRSEFIGGWPSFWDSGEIKYKLDKQKEWKTVGSEMIWYQ